MVQSKILATYHAVLAQAHDANKHADSPGAAHLTQQVNGKRERESVLEQIKMTTSMEVPDAGPLPYLGAGKANGLIHAVEAHGGTAPWTSADKATILAHLAT